MARLGIVACGAPLASRATDIVTAAENVGMSPGRSPTLLKSGPPHTVGTRQAGRQMPSSCARSPSTLPTSGLGIADTPWLNVLCEAVAADTRIVAVPMVNETLWRHPAWENTWRAWSRPGLYSWTPRAATRSPPRRTRKRRYHAGVRSFLGPSVAPLTSDRNARTRTFVRVVPLCGVSGPSPSSLDPSAPVTPEDRSRGRARCPATQLPASTSR